MLRFPPALRALLLAVACASAGAPAWAEEALPTELQGVDVVEHLGDQVPMDLVFTDHTGAQQTMADLMAGDVPVLLTLNYFSCATLCGVQLNGLLNGLQALDWTAGERFRVITISIDPRESSELAATKRQGYLNALGRGDDVDWRFLVGTQDQIQALASAVGFGYRYDEDSGQFAHPAVLTFLAPNGSVARYIYGVDYAARDLRFALMEAAAGRVGSPVDKLVLSCFQYDSSTGRYTPAAFGVMRLGGVFSLFGLGALGLVMWRRELKERVVRSDVTDATHGDGSDS